MKLKDLIEKATEIMCEYGNEDFEVMFEDDDGRIFSATSIKHRVAEEDEFPADYSMPEGFEFVLIRN